MSQSKQVFLPKLFEPGRIGTMEVRNRLVMAPMGTSYAGEDGSVSPRIKAYYGARARGGAGLIIVECTCVERNLGKTSRLASQLLIDDDNMIPGLAELARSIQEHGAKAAIQLHHSGREGHPKQQPVAPSAIAAFGGQLPRELTVAEIGELVDRFAQAAGRARKAGFDGVEIHGASDYLIDQFLSGFSNKRSDDYGGSVENRARFLIEIVRAIRGVVGPDYPVWCRINGQEPGLVGGIILEESCRIARMAEEAGSNAVHVTTWGPGEGRVPVTVAGEGYLASVIAGVKKAVTVPVIGVGRINPELGEEMLRQGNADFIAVGRGFLTDPDFPQKAASGALEDITPCICCNSCGDSIRGFRSPGRFMHCAVNAATGKETESVLQPAEKTRKVMVIGGGPAGLEAARVAALRGHRVVVYEQEKEPGGQLNLASLPPHKSAIQPFIGYLVRQLNKLGVRLVLGTKAGLQQVAEESPDIIILAAGSRPIVPKIRGGDKGMLLARDVLREKVDVGERVVIIGGGLVGCETAEFLAEKGKKLTIVEILGEIAADVGPQHRVLLLERLADRGVEMIPSVQDEEFVENGLMITAGGEKRLLQADSIVIAAGARQNTELFDSLQKKGRSLYLIGDCIEPGAIRRAIYDGFTVGRLI